MIIICMLQIDDEPFNPEYTVADRVIDVAKSTEPNGEVIGNYEIHCIYI